MQTSAQAWKKNLRNDAPRDGELALEIDARYDASRDAPSDAPALPPEFLQPPPSHDCLHPNAVLRGRSHLAAACERCAECGRCGAS